MPAIFTISSLAGPGGTDATATDSPTESPGAEPTVASIPGSPPPDLITDLSIGSASIPESTAASPNPETGSPTGEAPLTTGLAGIAPTGTATTPVANGTDELSSIGWGSGGGVETTPAAVASPATPTITTAGAAAAATTIAVEYGEEFNVSVASLVQASGDLFENYTLSSPTPGGAEDVDDVTIWWDRPDLEFGGVVVAGPASGPAVWLVHVTMRRAGGEDIYYLFVVEIDVAGTYDGTGASGAGSGVPSGFVSVSQDDSPSQVATPFQVASPSEVASPSPAGPPIETAPDTETTTPPIESWSLSETPQAIYPTQSPSAAGSSGLAIPVITWSNSSTSTPSETMMANNSLSSTAFASSSSTPDNPYEVTPGENFTISLTKVSGNPKDKFVSFAVSTSPDGYDTSWILYDSATATFYGQVPDDFPSVTIILKIVVQRTISAKRQDGTVYSVELGLCVKGSSSGVASVSPTTPSLYASVALPGPALVSSGALASPSPTAAPSFATPAAAGVEVANQTAPESSIGLAGLQAVQNAGAVPESLLGSGLSPVVVQTSTTWNATAFWTTGTTNDGSVTTSALPADPAGFLVAYEPVESSTSDQVAGEGSAGTTPVPATSTQSGAAPSVVWIEEATADPLTTVVVTTYDMDFDAPLITAESTSAMGTASRPVGTTAGGQNAPASVSLLPVTAGAMARDGTTHLESIVFMVLGVALGALLLA